MLERHFFLDSWSSNIGNRKQTNSCTLTRHIFSCLSALMIMSHMTLAQGVRARHTIHVSCACVFDLSSTLSSHSSFVSPIFYFILSLHLLCGIGSEINPICALPRMRSLAFWSTTPLSQVMSPTSSMTTTSQRPLKFSSGSLPATPSPRTYMTRRSVTAPSAERSLHHCSLRSEKNFAGRRQAYHSLEGSLLSS